MLSSTFFPSKESEKDWANHTMLAYQTDDEIEMEPCIFQVSKTLKDTKPDAYTPQKIGLGPFHHCHPKWQKNNKKISAVKHYLKTIKFEEIVESIKRSSELFELTIRSCYGWYLDLDKETLLLIVIIDTIYLLHFIDTYLGPEEGKDDLHELVRDIMMLENQIPLTLIQEVLKHLKELHPEEDVTAEDELFDKFYSFCSRLYPVKLADVRESMKEDFSKINHLLHFMHQLVVGTTVLRQTSGEPAGSRTHALASAIHAVRQARELFTKTIGEIKTLTETAKSTHARLPSLLYKLRNSSKALNPIVEEPNALDKIHSVSDLNDISKTKFVPLPVGYGFGSFKFDQEKNEIYLPIMTLDSNTEVILRNLLAYETESEDHDKQESSEVKDHMGLMCAITRTERDVTLLKHAKILITEMEDKEVVKLFNGLKNSMQKQGQKSKLLDMFCKFTNKDYDNLPVVKACNWIKKRMEAFSKFLKSLFATFVVLLLFFQSFCEMYDCRQQPWFGSSGEAAKWNRPLPKASFPSLESQAEIIPPRKVLGYSS